MSWFPEFSLLVTCLWSCNYSIVSCVTSISAVSIPGASALRLRTGYEHKWAWRGFLTVNHTKNQRIERHRRSFIVTEEFHLSMQCRQENMRQAMTKYVFVSPCPCLHHLLLLDGFLSWFSLELPAGKKFRKTVVCVCVCVLHGKPVRPAKRFIRACWSSADGFQRLPRSGQVTSTAVVRNSVSQ